MTSPLASAKRVVVKIGSALLVEAETGRLKRAWLDALADDVAAMKRRGQQVVIVSSGAIALGRRHLGLTAGALKLEESQAAAATGQIRLAHAYQETLARHDVTVSQVLLTAEDTEDRRRYLNARNTIDTLLKLGAVPVINENDTVATAEIRYGDNDRLAARVAAMIGADALVLLSDIDGLYTADPASDPKATLIREVKAVTAEIEAMASGPRSADSRGGMTTKIQAARIAITAGCAMAIASGKVLHPLRRVWDGGVCTWFRAAANPKTARKQWIAGSINPAGRLRLDAGALKALRRGTSLLPAGVTAVEGQFERGDLVLIEDADGRQIGRGLIAYNSEDAARIKGHKSAETQAILGYRGRDEMIHRDDLVLDEGP